MPVRTNSPKTKTLLVLDQCPSTNNYAMQIARNGMAADGFGILAMYQTAGKGQQQKTWFSNQGESILFSVIADAREMPADSLFLLSMSVAVATAQFFGDYATTTAHIKWPNDIYWNDKKAGGILIEPILRGNVCQYAIIGIGLNINQERFPSNLANAVSLYMASGKKQNIINLALMLRLAVIESVSFCLAYPEKTVFLYNQLLYRKNEKVFFEINQQISTYRVVGVNASGQIILGDNDITSYRHDEAKWLLD